MLEQRLQLGIAFRQRLLVLGIQLCARGAQLGVHSFELAATLMKLDQHCDLAAQDLRYDRYGDVVDCAELVALQPVELADVHGGDEDDRRQLQSRMLPHQARHLEAVHFRHVHIQQDRCELLFEQPFQRLRARERPDALNAQAVQDRLVGQESRRLVVHEQDAGARRSRWRLAGHRGRGGLTCLQRAHVAVDCSPGVVPGRRVLICQRP